MLAAMISGRMRSSKTRLARAMTLAAMAGMGVMGSCLSGEPQRAGESRSGVVNAPSSEALEQQALVMGAADEYIAALGEAVYLIARAGEQTPKARALTQLFVRNGTTAALDIATKPNPSVAMLDMMVLSSLQTWSFENHWMPAGIGEAGRGALDRLKAADAEVWRTARARLSESQVRTVRDLVDSWIAQNPDRTITSLARFEDFADARMMNTMNDRGRAAGLLREVALATSAIDDARLLGERALWYASRYPFLLGQQTELTM
jgi:hypothetical protein